MLATGMEHGMEASYVRLDGMIWLDPDIVSGFKLDGHADLELHLHREGTGVVSSSSSLKS